MHSNPQNPEEVRADAIFEANLNPLSDEDLMLFSQHARQHLADENPRKGPEATMARRQVVLDQHLEPKAIRGAIAGAVLGLLIGWASGEEPSPITLLAIPAGVASIGAMADQERFRRRAKEAMPSFFEPPYARESQKI